MTKKSVWMGASILAAASMGVVGAHAQTTQVFGGGGATTAPSLRQAEDCYGVPTSLVIQGAYPYGAGSNSSSTETPFNYTGTKAFNCATSHVDSSVQLNYVSSNSGNGELGVFTHDESDDLGVTTVPATGAYAAVPQYTGIDYASGDYAIAGDAALYASGGVLSQKDGGNNAVTILPPGSSTTPSGRTYANPVAKYGNLIQFPIAVVPIAVAYSPVYKVDNTSGAPVSYKFNIHKPNKDGSGGLLLNMQTVCAIFNGQITNWNDPALTKLNGNVSLKDPTDPTPVGSWSVPIEMVGRSDSSGTTSIFYRALAAQCTSGSSGYTGTNNYVAAGGKTVPSALLGPTWAGGTADNGPNSGVTPVSGKFTVTKGSDQVAEYLTFSYAPPAGSSWTQGRLGFIGPDYTVLAAHSNNNKFGLNVADVAPFVG
ncbi:MAG: substrate-binding domain-containing protein, partial [Caulobacteraceae bacterium]|nr:substrate-binding domain-containing protein [Caulobacteraceae bacterium]